MNLYSFSGSTIFSKMEDNSGVVVYDSFSGMTAFINSSPDSIHLVQNLIRNTEGFNDAEFLSALSIDLDAADKLLKWLLDNYLIKVRS